MVGFTLILIFFCTSGSPFPIIKNNIIPPITNKRTEININVLLSDFFLISNKPSTSAFLNASPILYKNL